MKNWKSNDNAKNLANTQKAIIRNFISNLYKLYHHNEHFVQKVLGYLYASRDGLSESELLQLLSTDEEFIKSMSPSDHHENPTKELPLVHWSRLHTQLKPFLSQKSQDGEELMYFFHREFGDVVKEQINQQLEHENIIKATQVLIERNQDDDFYSNRWGSLYITTIFYHYKKFNKLELLNTNSKFITTLINVVWQIYSLWYIMDEGEYLSKNNVFHDSHNYFSIAQLVSLDILFKDIEVYNLYCCSSIQMSLSYKFQGMTKLGIEILEKSVAISEEIIKNNPLPEVNKNLKILLFILSKLYEFLNDYDMVESIDRKSLALSQDNQKIDQFKIGTLISSADTLYRSNSIYDAIESYLDILSILEEHIYQEPIVHVQNYNVILSKLTLSARKIQHNDKAEYYSLLNVKTLEKLYNQNINEKTIIQEYILALCERVYFLNSLINNKPVFKIITISQKIFNLLDYLYKSNSNYWSKYYIKHVQSISSILIEINQLEYVQPYIDRCLNITSKYYSSSFDIWTSKHIENLHNSSEIYLKLNNIEKAVEVQREVCSLMDDLYEQNEEEWEKQYLDEYKKLALLLKKTDIEESIKIQISSNALIYLKTLGDNKYFWIKEYLQSLSELSETYFSNGEIKKAIKKKLKEFDFLEDFIKSAIESWIDDYLFCIIGLSGYLETYEDYNAALKIEKKGLNILKEFYKDESINPSKSHKDIFTILSNMIYLNEELLK